MAHDFPSDAVMARAITGTMLLRLNDSLADPYVRSITLTREEAILMLGLVECAAKQLTLEDSR